MSQVAAFADAEMQLVRQRDHPTPSDHHWRGRGGGDGAGLWLEGVHGSRWFDKWARYRLNMLCD
jgi:hypothetical protein